MPRTPSSASLSVDSAAADALRRLAFALSAHLGRRVTMSDALMVAATLAITNLATAAALLTTERDAQ
jgi:hypothetical protein